MQLFPYFQHSPLASYNVTKLAATPDGQKKFTTVFSEGGVVVVTVLRHPRSKNMSWLPSDHDFVPCPSDRKNSYGMMVVTPPLILMTLSKTKRTFLIQPITLATLGGP